MLTVAVFADLERMSSKNSLVHGDKALTCEHAISTYVKSTPYQSPYTPGTITMEERYMSLLTVLNEASARFPEPLTTRS